MPDTFVEWTKDLEIGVPFVDADHKVLINLLNQAHDCIASNEETTVLGSVLDALVEYTDYHFHREEKMMELSGYAELSDHAATHRVLSSQVRDVYTMFQNDPRSVDPVEVRDFLKSWLVEHIMGHDFNYRDACLDNAEAAAQAGAMPFFAVSREDGEGEAPAFAEWEHLRVMLVDDNANFRRLIHTILKAVGVRNLQLAETPEDGIARLTQRPADVVLCDWVMEDMNGAEFARKVSELELPSRVVLMTGYSTDTLRERSSDIDVAGYLEKPVRARHLLETISRAAMGFGGAVYLGQQATGLG